MARVALAKALSVDWPHSDLLGTTLIAELFTGFWHCQAVFITLI
jgi:hypothetical protein